MGCTGCNDGCFDESVQLALGPAGSNGLYGGWSLKWKFDSNVGPGTGSSEVRLNNVSPVSATVIYVNDDAFGTGAADVFLSSVTSAPYGRIKIFKEYDSTIFWLATITAADDTIVPAEVKFTVTDVVTNGSFTDADDIVLTLAPAGATGATGTGTPGASGTTLLKSITTEQVVVASSYASGNVFSHTVPLNTLNINEDTLQFKGIVLHTENDATVAGLNITFASTDLQIGFYAPYYDFPNIETQGTLAYQFVIDIVRVSNTVVRVESDVTIIEDSNSSILGGSYSLGAVVHTSNNYNRVIKRANQTISGLNLTTTAYDFKVNLQTNSASRPTKLVQGKLILLNKG